MLDIVKYDIFFSFEISFFFLEGSSWAPHGPEACPYNQIFKEQNLSFNTWIFIFNIWKLPQPRLSSLNFRFLKKNPLTFKIISIKFSTHTTIECINRDTMLNSFQVTN